MDIGTNFHKWTLIGAMLLSSLSSVYASDIGMKKHHLNASLERLKVHDAGEKKKRTDMEPDNLEVIERTQLECQSRDYFHEMFCLKQKYMRGDYYLIMISFNKESYFPEPPLGHFIKDGDRAGQWDDSAKGRFLEEWTQTALIEYLGPDYSKYYEATLIGINHLDVSFEILVQSANELQELIKDARITNLTHIGSPSSPAELIIN